jgi:lactoylglutathione lyase
MFRKIDCVMIYVGDLELAVAYYTQVFGLHSLWRDAWSIGLGFPEADAEIVLHNDSGLPSKVEVHYLVDDVIQAVVTLRQESCTILVEPFDIAIGKCAVVQDPFGTRLSILDMSRGPRASE